jgi:hypothetical protein
MGEIKIPQQKLEDERIRTTFTHAIQQPATDHGTEIEDKKRKFLAHYEKHNPEFFDTLTRPGITSTPETPA